MNTSADVARLDAVVRSLHDAVCLVDAGGRVVACNDEFRNHWIDAFGRSPHPGEPLDDAVGRSEEATFWTDFLRRALRGRTMMADGWHEAGGRKRYLAVSSSPVMVDDVAEGATIVVRDITDRRRRGHREIVELALTRIFGDETSLLDNLVKVMEFLCTADGWDLGIVWLTEEHDLVPVAVWHDGSPHAVEFEESARAVRFAPGHGIPGRALRDNELIWVPDLADETVNVRTMHASRLGFRGVVAIPITDSSQVIGVFELFTCSARQVTDETARALHDTGIAVGRLIERHREHVERAGLLAALERKSTEWARTFDSIPLPIFLTTTSGDVVRVNDAARTLSGSEKFADVLGQPIAALGDGEPWPTLHDCIAAVGESGTPCTAQTVDVLGRHWDVSGSAYGSADAAEERVIIVMRDVTTIVQLQESVRRGEQLAAMGELVAGVAHEVRNPLFGMTITLDAYEPSVNQDDDAAEMFTALRQWIARLNLLMENLLEYGKTWNVDLREGPLESVVAEAVELSAGQAAQAGVAVRSECEQGLSMLMDPQRLGQAIQNLIINAIQHSPAQAEVTVEARRDGGEIECVVRDCGPGFEARDLPRIFEPCFTRRRGGTGLGLSIVQRVADEHGGTVTAENDSNGGARVRLRFPTFQP